MLKKTERPARRLSCEPSSALKGRVPPHWWFAV